MKNPTISPTNIAKTPPPTPVIRRRQAEERPALIEKKLKAEIAIWLKERRRGR